MTGKERVLATIEARPVDRVPVHHISFSGQVAAAILGREALVGGAFVQWREMQALWDGPDAHAAFEARLADDALAVAEACGHDLLRIGYWRWPASRKPTRRLDEHTFLFGDPDGAWETMTYHPDVELFSRTCGGKDAPGEAGDAEITEEALAEQVLAEEDRARAYAPPAGPDAKIAAAIARYPDYLLKLGGGTVFVDMREARQLMAAALWPELYHRLLMARADRLAKDLPGMAAAGMQVNFAGMDFCSKDGPSISPGLFRDVVASALKRLVDACHACGMYYFYGSDGNFWPVAADLFDVAGVDGWFELDRSAGMELGPLRERFPRVTLIGNLPVQVLHRGTKEDVAGEVMACLSAAHEFGGIIVGASNLIMPGTPPENVQLMLELIEKNR